MIKWKDQVKLAKAMGISPSFVNDILNRRRPCPVKRAHVMGKAYHDLFGVYVPFWEFTFNSVSRSVVFRNADYEALKRVEEARYGNNRPRKKQRESV
jgi:predicted transcriptional regulator